MCFEKSLAPAIALRYNRRKTNQFNQFYAEVNFRFTLEPRRNFAVTLTNKVLRVNMRCITCGLDDKIIILNDDRDNRNTHFPNVTLKRRAINRFLYSRVTETQTIPNVSRTKYISNISQQNSVGFGRTMQRSFVPCVTRPSSCNGISNILTALVKLKQQAFLKMLLHVSLFGPGTM